MRADLHTHSAVSDGTDSPAQLVRRAAEARLEVVALTDHDTFAGFDEARSEGARVGVQVLRGVEMSTNLDGYSVHLLGYEFDPEDEALLAELGRLRDSRSNRLPAMVSQLRAAGIEITMEEVLAVAEDATAIGRPHVADVLVDKGVVPGRREAFDLWLGEGMPGYALRYSTPLERAIRLLHEAGGAAVIAHPAARQSVAVLDERRLEHLAHACGLDGIEVDHQDHDAPTRRRMAAIAERLGLVRTGSSDYHGTGKIDHPLGCNLTAPDQLAELAARVEERGGTIGLGA